MCDGEAVNHSQSLVMHLSAPSLLKLHFLKCSLLHLDLVALLHL